MKFNIKEWQDKHIKEDRNKNFNLDPELLKLAKKTKGFKGDKTGFVVKTATGNLEVNAIFNDDKRVNVTWVSGGSQSDTDIHKVSQVISMLKNLQR